MKKLKELSLEDLNILKTHAYQYLAKLERLAQGAMNNISDYNYIEFSSWANKYKLLEDEMNERINFYISD